MGAPYLRTLALASIIRRASLWPSSTAAGMVKDSPSSSTFSPAAMSRRATTMLSSGCSSSSGGRRLSAMSLWFKQPPAGSMLLRRGRCVGRRRRHGFFVHERLFIERFFFDIAVAHLVLAPLQPSITHEGVPVETLRELRIEIEQAGAQVDDLDRRDGVARAVVLQIVRRVGEGVGNARESIANRGGAHERHHEIGARGDAPHAQRLAEVFIVLGDAGLGGRVEQTTETESGIEQQAGRVLARGAHLAL